MTYSILWTLLPNGIDAARGVARLTLAASPRASNTHTKLGDSPLQNWPAISAALQDIHIRESNVKAPPIRATIVGERPQLDLWRAIFPPTARALPFDKTDAPILIDMASAYSVAGNASAVDSLYAEVLRSSPTERLTRAHPALARVASLVQPSGGAALAADLEPVAATARRLLARAQARARASASAGAAAPLPASAKIRSFDEADVHQVIGMLMDHPALARRLGLLIDLEIPVFTGDRILRACDAAGAPLNGPVALAQPWSHVVCDPAQQRFVMKTQPDAPAGATEIVNGMLDIRPDADSAKYRLTDMDVLSSAMQLQGLAERLASSAVIDPGSLPGRRNGGLTLAQTERATRTLKHSVARSARFDGPSAELDGAPVLYADDVTSGYRVDVSRDGGPFLSLMRRVVTYRAGNAKQPSVLVVTDEGKVEAGSAVEDVSADGTPQLLVGEELFAWTDWSLAAPRPGPVARDDGETDVGTEAVTPGTIPGFPITIDVKAEPGSLPRLRFGSTYRVRVRAADLAGNSVDPATCDPAFVSPPLPYRRLQRAGAPELVPRRAYGPGESLRRLVVRSDGAGNPLGAACERHVLPPSISHDVAQLHGAFDAALGPDSPARKAARDALLRVGHRQDGNLHQPVVIGPNGTAVPAAGITVARLDASSKDPLATLPLPRGATLPQGQYVHHDTDQMLVPYLADPAVAGAAFRWLPPIGTAPAKAPLVVSYGAQPWPDPQPFRFIAKAGAAAATSITKGAEGHMALTATVAPAQSMVVTLSSALTRAAVQQMDPSALVDPVQAEQGEVHLFSQPQQVTLVHAVQTPLEAPELLLTTVDRPNTGNTWVRLAGRISVHRPSTSRAELEASWTEIIDDGKGKVSFEPRSIIVGAVTFDGDGNSQAFDVKQQFGDAKRRKVTYKAVATTRFTDCFAAPAPGQERLLQRLGAGQVIDVQSTHRPPSPEVHSCIPIFRWVRSVAAGTYSSVRRCAGVRVYLRPKWFVTGEGESLGVVLHASPSTAATMQASADADLFTRWGRDPLETSVDQDQPPVAEEFISNRTGTMLFRDLPGATTENTQPVYKVVSVPVAFDESRGLWYADIEHAGSDTIYNDEWAFMRYGLVRIQAGTVSTPDANGPARHVSGVVVTDAVQLAPTRMLTARRTGPTDVYVTLGFMQPGTNGVPTVCLARWQRRTLEPLASLAPDIAQSGPSVAILSPITTNAFSREGTVHESSAAVSPTLFKAGRIVVEEGQSGFDLGQEEGTALRVVYREILECTVFDRPDGPLP